MPSPRSAIRLMATAPAPAPSGAPTSAPTGGATVWILAGTIAVAALLLIAVGLVIATKPTTPLHVPATAPAIAAAVLTPTPPACYDAAHERRQIQDFLTTGKVSFVVGLAENALARQDDPPLCRDARRALAGFWYTASVEALHLESLPDDMLGHEPSIRWTAIEERADAYEIPKSERVPPMLVARRAYDRQNWPLADAAARRAWDLDRSALEVVRFRYQVLRNWGGALAFRGGPQQQADGVRLLMTAHAIDAAYGLNLGVACTDLHDLGHTECDGGQGATDDPMLVHRRTTAAR